MGEAKRMASAWSEQPVPGPPKVGVVPPPKPLPGPTPPDDRERMLWQAMLAVAPAVYERLGEDEVYPTIALTVALTVREIASALVREWEQQCRPGDAR